jgi:hypothetical protein
MCAVGNCVAGGIGSAGENRGDEGAGEAGHLRSQFLIVTQKGDMVNISRMEERLPARD